MRGKLSAWQMNKIARSPSAYMKFVTGGGVPEPAKPRSPLIDLLQSLSPRERLAIRDLTVDHRLGYMGQRQFQTVANALNWLTPSYPAESYPSQSWQDKRFTKKLTLEDLVACTAMAERAAEQAARVEDPEPLSGPEL